MNESPDVLREQLIELQTQIAFQENNLSDLDAVVTAQQRRIDDLEQLYGRLVRQLDQMADVGAEPGDETPPHY